MGGVLLAPLKVLFPLLFLKGIRAMEVRAVHVFDKLLKFCFDILKWDTKSGRLLRGIALNS